ncbi:glycoside hydrolase family 19 protein [Dyadobacter sp. CY351]|uniref:glycoside hydrolase family 19 protein n=1 Tax=Dyadobacter sp. CY351 TaxID=2909337 RepID=UPI001F38E58E|nr:glycoside hydrolase family 19 protein [Dyadobacter sp. CY351]MCF2518554.1 hypothetical protein [Dyadobacter sp. CY351]
MDEFEISENAGRRNMFLAQVSHESRFNANAENLNYSAEALVKTWPSRFVSLEFAREFARNPEKIGDFVYSNRLSLGNGTNEGFLYRGRGGIQITGKSNYREVSTALGLGSNLVINPDLLLDDNLAWRASAWFWKTRNLNELVDKKPGDVKAITKVVNGGFNNLDHRVEQYRRILHYMPDNGGELLANLNLC